MARKSVFERSLHRMQADGGETKEPEQRVAPNVRYFGDAFEEQMQRTAQDIAPETIALTGFHDRLDVSADLDDLIESIRQSGQQVPVLVRRLHEDGSLQAVYGRRRIIACQKLGRPVRGVIMSMSDDEALLAQGLENSARLNTSYIERARFALQMEQTGYEAEKIQEILNLDRTVVSRLLKVAKTIPEELMRAIGPAHGIGRRPWMRLSDLVAATREELVETLPAIAAAVTEATSEARLKAVIKHLEDAHKTPKVLDERRIGSGAIRMRVDARSLTFRADLAGQSGFLTWLAERSESLHAEWSEENSKEDGA